MGDKRPESAHSIRARCRSRCHEEAGYKRAVSPHVSSRLACTTGRVHISVPGIGPINATLLLSHLGDPRRFPNGRQFSASIGLVPRQFSSGGKARLKGITKRGNGEVRRQLVHGARAALRQFQRQATPDRLARWVCELAARVGQRKAIVALANKLARICWSVLAHGRPYQPQGQAI